MNMTYFHRRTTKLRFFSVPIHRLLLVLSILLATIGIPTSRVSADPGLPLPRMPICGDQDGSELPLVFRCPDFVPSMDVPTYEVPGTGSRNFLFDFVFREAGYNNELGMFKVDSASGAIGGLLPGDSGYLAAAFQRKTIIFPSGSTAYAPDVTLQLQGGDIYVFFIIQGTTTTNFLANNPNNNINQSPLAFFSLEGLNPDGVDHFVGFHNTVNGFSQFGFEDLTGGGDVDYDDVVYNISPPLRPEPPQPDNPPLVLVHGWQGGANGDGDPQTNGYHCNEGIQEYDPNNPLHKSKYLGSLPDWFTALGYQVWLAHWESNPTGTTSLLDNAICLREQIKYVHNNQNPQPITIVAHSMGGVISRAAIRLLGSNSEVTKEMKLFTLGSPHAGLSRAGIFKVYGLHLSNQFAVFQMAEDLMNGSGGFNGVFNNATNVEYYFIGGTASPLGPKGSGWFLYPYPTKHDGLVSSYSSIGWNADGVYDPPSWTENSLLKTYWTTETHSGTYDPYNNYYTAPPGDLYSSAFFCIKELIGGRTPPSSACEPVGNSSWALANNSIDINTISTFSPSTEFKTGHLDASQSVSIPLTIDANSASLFYLTWAGEAPSFTLTRPDNLVIDPAYATAHPSEVSYESFVGGAEVPPYKAYKFNSVQPGTWQLNITAAGAIDYQTFANFDSSRTLTAQTNADIYNIGNIATITANLQNGGVGIAGASVIATLTRPDAVVNTIPLVYQGNGIYTANYTIPNTPGYLKIGVTANGNDNGTAFSRQEHLLTAIKSNDLQLTGSYGDQPRDDDADGLYEKLEFQMGLNLATAGEYSVTAELYAGNQLITQSGDFFDLVAGSQTITLPFDGGAIREAGLNGPYTIKNLSITPINLGITTQSVNSAWTTVAYNYSQFGLHPCYLLTLSHTGSGLDPTASPANSSGCAASEYVPGETIDLVASPSINWHLSSWTGTLNDSSTELSNTAIMPASNHSVTVDYASTSNLIFANSFYDDDCFLSQWSSCVDDGGDLIFNPPELVPLSDDSSMNVIIDDNNVVYVTSDHPNAETRYLASFYFDPNSISMVSGDTHVIFGGYSGTSTLVLRVQFRKSSGNYQVQASLLHDNSTWNTSSWFTISDAPHKLELDWRAATVAGANNGGLTFWIDGAQKANKTAADNDTWRIDRAQLGAVAGIDAGTRGTYYFDQFESSRGGGGPTATPFITPTKTFTPVITPTLTNTPNVTNLIFADGFESGDFSRWPASSCVTDSGDLSVSAAAKYLGNYGMQALLDDNVAIYCTSDHPNAEPRYLASFYFDPNSISMVSGDTHTIFGGYSGTSTLVLRVQFRKSSGNYQVQASLLHDNSTWNTSSWFTISDAPHKLELDWKAATAAGSNNGGLTFWIDGTKLADKTAADNDTWRIDRARLGAIAGIDTGTRGAYYFDEFESNRGGMGPTATPSITPTQTFTPVITPTRTFTPSATFTRTPTSPVGPSPTPTRTLTPSITPSPTNTSGASDVIFANDFEDDDCFTTQWSSCVDDSGDVRFDPPALAEPLSGSSMNVIIDDNNPIYVTSDHPNAEPRYRARFYFDPNSIPMTNGDAHFIFKGFTGTSTEVLRVEFARSSGAYQIRASLLDDTTIWVNTGWFTITDAPHSIELDWRASTAVGANNGGLTLWIDDGLQQASTSIVDNDTRRIDRVRLGALTGIDTSTRGTYYFDAFESRRQTYIGP